MINLDKKIQQLKSNRKEIYREAEKILNSGGVLYFRKISDTESEFTVWNNKEKKINILSLNELDNDFNILNSEKRYSAFELASIIHYLRNDMDSKAQLIPVREENNKKEERNPCFLPPTAELRIELKNDSLHASSVWEENKISITIIYKNKSYVGSSSKLRNLRFDENKSGSFEFVDFSYQDRQIIRFLTQYAEPDSSNFALKGDVMSEFLHCLDENKPIFSNNIPLIIHKQNVEFVGLYKDSNNSIYPSIIIENRVLPLDKPCFISGRSGFWVGCLGEYWWIPGIIDLVWLRNFILSGEMKIDDYSKVKNFPLPVLKYSGEYITNPRCIPIYYVNISSDKQVILSLKFKYSDKEFSLSNHRLILYGDFFMKRNKEVEDSVLKELMLTGFKEEKDHPGHFSLSDIEQKGLFFKYTLNKWIDEDKHIFLSPEASKIYNNICKLKFNCTNPKLEDDKYIFRYSLYSENGNHITWKELLKEIKSNRRFIEFKNHYIAEIPYALSRLVLAFKNIISVTKKNSDKLEIPKAALFYLLDIGKDSIVSIPKEWLNKEKAALEQENISLTENCRFKGILRDYQKDSVKWMYRMITNGFNPVLADEMGLGKTIQTLALINLLKQNKKIKGPCLVICPTSLTSNWESEANKFVPNLKTIVIEGSKRVDAIYEIYNFDLIITSYSLIKKDIEFYEKQKFSLLILDEAQYIKNPSTINAQTCKTIRSDFKLVLTGTPLENTTDDLWSIFDFLNPGMLGNRESFRSLYSKIENDYEKQKELAKRIAPFIIRRHKENVENLPSKTEHLLYCDLLPRQEEIYKEVLKDGINKFNMFSSGKLTRFDVLSSLTRLRQICCHPLLLPDLIGKNIAESAKMNLLKELVYDTIDTGQKTLIFSQFTSLLSIIKEWFDHEKILYEYLDGATIDRQNRVNNFNQNSDIKIFLLSLKAGGTGLNITSASNVIIYDPWWNPTAELQATDRTHRIGQDRPVNTFKLVVRNTIEEKILELQNRKKGLFNGIIEKSAGFKKITDKDIEFLFS